ncbi:MAG: hypothetical protein P8J86_11105 [Phycisphaerales bacterium]|nr:hypothetical protein [Phycisphaerales bacterium]
MSDSIGHYCGITLVRQRHGFDYYRQELGDAAWCTRRLCLLMQKQYNRGQDGAGLTTVKFDMPPGAAFLNRTRSDKNNAIEHVIDEVTSDLNVLDADHMTTASDEDCKLACSFLGEASIGHLRYGTHSSNALANCHPLIRRNITASRNLAIAGNFNMTNSGALFDQLVELGLSPVGDSDTQVVLERMGYFLDQEHRHLNATMGPGSLLNLEGRELAAAVAQELDPTRIVRKVADGWDGGYAFAVLLGNGDAFAFRDPAGIRPCYWLMNDRVVAVASERGALLNVFNASVDEVQAVQPGHVLVIKRNGEVREERFADPLPIRQCTFERIYFSRVNDPDIYHQRKQLGRALAPRVLDAVKGDIENTVFSYIPNTAETAHSGLIEQIERLSQHDRADQIIEAVEDGSFSRESLLKSLDIVVRNERIAYKDQRLRTFITHDRGRRRLVMHIYDILRGVVSKDDTLVVLDDSIVRGTTLRESIIKNLSRLEPKRIIIVSSAPPIMYPDCYGIDMSELGRFIAFEAAITLIRENSMEDLLKDVEKACATQARRSASRMKNHVKRLYDEFSLEQLSETISKLVRPKDISWGGKLEVVYQRVEDLRSAMPEFTGDWYFTGDYPTPGGLEVVNTSFLNWYHQIDGRAY